MMGFIFLSADEGCAIWATNFIEGSAVSFFSFSNPQAHSFYDTLQRLELSKHDIEQQTEVRQMNILW